MAMNASPEDRPANGTPPAPDAHFSVSVEAGGTERAVAMKGAMGEPKTKFSVRNLDFYYGRKQALHGVSMDIPELTVTAIIGPSGCGKSTLLRVLNRMYALYPDQRAEGEVLLDGQNILESRVDLNVLRANIGMVFQKPTPFPMTIYDNIAFGVRLYKRLSSDAMDAQVEQALRKAALWDEVKDDLRKSGLSLSGGQQQRLCIARAPHRHAHANDWSMR